MNDPIPSSREVYDPAIGSDGGQGGELPAIDPENPVDHVEELRSSAALPEAPVGFERPTSGATPPVCCPRCGTAVHPNRLRA